MLRAVVDTNVFVSALLGSPTNRALKTSLEESGFQLVTSTRLLAELTEVLSRPAFKISTRTVADLIALVIQRAEIAPAESTIKDCRDPKDNLLLEVAMDGRASHLVTGDDDLLVLNPFRGVQIMRPARFIEFLR